ncbi:unnamed protein product [Prunus brigantina]
MTRKIQKEKSNASNVEVMVTYLLNVLTLLNKQRDVKNRASNTTWNDSESEFENDEKTVALITTVSLDESHEDDDSEDMKIEFTMKKYNDLLAVSQKLNKQNVKLVKSVAELKLENSRIANEDQSLEADSEK